MSMNFVAFINGIVMMAISALMALTAVLFPTTAHEFTEAFVLTGFLGAVVTLAAADPAPELRPRHIFPLTASVWLVAALCGALPLFLWRMPAADAFFEAMSGVTTTGSTVLSGLDATPHGILFWRAMLQALGGIGFVVTGVALLPVLKVGGMQLFRTESSEQGEKELANAARFALATLNVYAVLMACCFLVYLLGGMSVFDAAVHAMTTLSTGGYSNYDASFGHFESAFLQYASTAFMLLAGFPFAWYIRAVLKRQFGSEQIGRYLQVVGAVIAVLTLWLVTTSGREVEPAFREVAFSVVSVITTTGYAVSDYTTWGSFAVAVFFAITAIGACTGSTSGGAKMMRWVVFLRLARREIRLVRMPHAVAAARYEGRPIQIDVIAGVTTFFTLYFGTVAVLAIALDLIGLDFLTALSGALTAVANVGPGVGGVIGPAGNFAPLGDGAKLLISAGMYLGRLEMMTVLVLLTPAYWRDF